MYKYKDSRYYNAGDNAFYKYGNKAQKRVRSRMKPNKNGYYEIEVDGEAYWTIGTSKREIRRVRQNRRRNIFCK